MPAPVADVPLTIWKRCGKPITAPRDENPVKNADLEVHISQSLVKTDRLLTEIPPRQLYFLIPAMGK